MSARRVNPYRIKVHRTYSAGELAACCGVHKNTVRNWQAKGLEPIDKGRPVLFMGSIARAFLLQRKASRKSPCPPGSLYCFRCRAPRRPALGMVELMQITPTSGNLRALCECCEAMMHCRVRVADLAEVMPGLEIQATQALPCLGGREPPSVNCDLKRSG